jgi:hypothetical protein
MWSGAFGGSVHRASDNVRESGSLPLGRTSSCLTCAVPHPSAISAFLLEKYLQREAASLNEIPCDSIFAPFHSR